MVVAFFFRCLFFVVVLMAVLLCMHDFSVCGGRKKVSQKRLSVLITIIHYPTYLDALHESSLGLEGPIHTDTHDDAPMSSRDLPRC